MPPAALQGAEVVVLDVSGGAGAVAPLGLGDRRHPTYIVTVRGKPLGKPIVLAVSAFQPAIWDISQVPAERLRAIVAFGFYPQGVSGAPAGIPIRFGSAGPGENSGFESCGRVNLGYSGTGTVPTYPAQVTTVLGRAPTRYFGGYQPSSFDIDTGATVSAPYRPVLQNLKLPEGAEISQQPMLVPSDAFANGGPVKTSLSWTGGVLDRAGNLPPRPRRFSPALRSDEMIRRRMTAPPSGDDGLGTLMCLIGLGVAGALALAIHRARGGRLPPALVRLKELATGSVDDPDGEPSQEQRSGYDRSAELTGAPAAALAACRAAEQRVAAVAPLDADLHDEVTVITGRRLPDLLGAFHKASRSEGASVAGETLLIEGLRRLTTQLNEVADEQGRRDGDALRTNARFLENRYPTQPS